MDVISFSSGLVADWHSDAKKPSISLSKEKVLAESCLGLCVK